MGECRVDGAQGPPVQSAEEMVGRFQAELMTAVPGWRERLRQQPEQLEVLEREVHAAFSRGADLVLVGLLAVVMKDAGFDQACVQTRGAFAYPLERGRLRARRVRLLGGLVLWITSWYCVPCRRSSAVPVEAVPGVYVELAQFGFGSGCTPGLESKVARQAALCPSFQLAQQELAGKRVSVQIDGGRTRLRGVLRAVRPEREAVDADGLPPADAPGRSRKRPRQTFDPDWREPKLLTIFVHDERGRMVKHSQAVIDGTFLGPEAIAEVVAMHLHRLGAAEAVSLTFVAVGGAWIWERIAAIIRVAKLQAVPKHEVLDCCHAAHHIALALAALGLKEKERLPLYREHRTLLRNGQWRRVVEELTSLAHGEPADATVWTEIGYLHKHGTAGRLAYPHFRALGLPLGSGAIESSIRRVVNLRLKGNAIYWREDNAEALLQIRAQVLTNRWDDQLAALHELHRHDARTDWRWTPQDMRSKPEATAPT